MNKLDTKLNEIIESKSILGIVCATINNDDIETISLGTSNGTKECTPDTRYDVASLTKIFVTIRIFQLIDDRKINLDTKVNSIISEFENESITISDLLLHRSGMMPSVRTRYQLSGNKLKNYIYSMNDYIDNQYGTTVYSCINYVLLGEIIERIDKHLNLSLEENIFKPLGMSNTSFNGLNAAPTELLEDGRIIQERVHDQTSFALGGVSGNAGIFTTLNDMILFVKGLLNKKIISSNTIELMESTNIGERSYGWNRFNEKNLYHTGSTGPLLFIDFENNRSLIILTNRTFPVLDNQIYLKQREELFNLYLKNL